MVPISFHEVDWKVNVLWNRFQFLTRWYQWVPHGSEPRSTSDIFRSHFNCGSFSCTWSFFCLHEVGFILVFRPLPSNFHFESPPIWYLIFIEESNRNYKKSLGKQRGANSHSTLKTPTTSANSLKKPSLTPPARHHCCSSLLMVVPRLNLEGWQSVLAKMRHVYLLPEGPGCQLDEWRKASSFDLRELLPNQAPPWLKGLS